MAPPDMVKCMKLQLTNINKTKWSQSSLSECLSDNCSGSPTGSYSGQ